MLNIFIFIGLQFCLLYFSNRTNHVFQLQGFSTEELLHRYVELEIIGKNNQRKEVIGTIVLAGKKCKLFLSL